MRVAVASGKGGTGKTAVAAALAAVRPDALVLVDLDAEALAQGRDMVLDAPPGVSCPAMAAVEGADAVLLVTEPTPSGLHDLQRVAAVCHRLRVPVAVVGNKWDLAPEMSLQVEAACQDQGWPVVARLPHDPAVPRAMAQGLAVTEWDAAGPWAQAVRPLWPALMQLMEKTGGIR